MQRRQQRFQQWPGRFRAALVHGLAVLAVGNEGRVQGGEQVPLAFTVKNVSTQAITYDSGSCIDYMTHITQGNHVIWQGPYVNCENSVRTVTLPPSQEQTYSFVWPQQNSAGNTVAAGPYTITTLLWPTSINGQDTTGAQTAANLTTNPITVSIQNP